MESVLGPGVSERRPITFLRETLTSFSFPSTLPKNKKVKSHKEKDIPSAARLGASVSSRRNPVGRVVSLKSVVWGPKYV